MIPVPAYDVMKGWGPVSLSALTQQAYFSHTLKKWNRSLKPPFITILELQILNLTKNMLKKTRHHCSYYHHHPNHHYRHHHLHLLDPGANPVWGPLGWRKHNTVTIVIIKTIIIIIIIIIIVIIIIVIAFLPPSGVDCI